MRPIVLLAVNARWTHTSFGSRCLMANLGALQSRAVLVERTVVDSAIEIVEAVLALDPVLVGLGVYIWNVDRCTEVVGLLKRLRPELPVVLGGPEVSFAGDAPEVVTKADWVVAGEGEVVFRRLCHDLLARRRPAPGYLPVVVPELDELELPYQLYSGADIGRRTIYLEASRGCPFRCELCLSGLEGRVRRVPRARLLAAVDDLWRRGARHFKLVDRALHLAIEPELLHLLLERWETGAFIHVEIMPDMLPQQLLDLLAQFPAGAVQVEAGIQTFNPAVAERIGRRQDLERATTTLRHLRRQTGVYIHADLVVGLPGESFDSFAAGFDRLLELAPHEIQVTLLKRLRGTPIPRHDQQWEMVYSPSAPYEVLRTSTIDFATMQRLRRFSRYFDLVYNSGSFASTSRLLLGGLSPFHLFLAFSDWLYAFTGQTHGIALHRLARLIFRYLTEELQISEQRAHDALAADYRSCGRVPIPLHPTADEPAVPETQLSLPPRQQRHTRPHPR